MIKKKRDDNICPECGRKAKLICTDCSLTVCDKCFDEGDDCPVCSREIPSLVKI